MSIVARWTSMEAVCDETWLPAKKAQICRYSNGKFGPFWLGARSLRSSREAARDQRAPSSLGDPGSALAPSLLLASRILLPTARHPGAPWCTLVHPGASLQPALLLNASVTLPHKHAERARRRQGSAWSLSRAGWALFASLRTAAVLHVAFTTRLCEILS